MDNSPHAYGYDLDNGIPIQSWFDDETDTELLKLIGFLKNVVDASDVRSVVRDHFKSYELVKNATLGYPGQCLFCLLVISGSMPCMQFITS